MMFTSVIEVRECIIKLKPGNNIVSAVMACGSAAVRHSIRVKVFSSKAMFRASQLPSASLVVLMITQVFCPLAFIWLLGVFYAIKASLHRTS